MNFNFLNAEKQNITVAVTSEQLHEFATQLLSGARELYEKKELPETYLTRKQTAEKLQTTLPTLWTWNKNGYLKNVHVGGKVRYKLSDVNKILGRGTTV